MIIPELPEQKNNNMMMDVALSASKKSRAKSCAACRQVKLRCDVRERFPEPCSRCVGRKLECRMDPNFKRVNTRGGSHARSEASTSSRPSTTPQSHHSHDLSTTSQTARAQDQAWDASYSQSQASQGSLPMRPSVTTPQASTIITETWFDATRHLNPQDSPRAFKLGEVAIETACIVDLFQHFQVFYYVHFPILEPLTSLHSLYLESPALFWSIIMTTSRHHPRQASVFPVLRKPFEQLVGNLLLTSVQKLGDLQALLMLCVWPLEVPSQAEDPSWLYIGYVVNAAVHMGLDRIQDEVLTGYRRAKNLSEIRDMKVRRKTWMKIFQVNTQIATWHGLPPQIASAAALQLLPEFYEYETNRELIASTEIQRQLVRNTVTLSEYGFRSPQITILQSMLLDFDALKRQYADVWCDSLEINLEAARLYALEHCLILADDHLKSNTPDAEHFVATTMQLGHSSAISLIEVIRQIGLATQPDPSVDLTTSGGSPLLAHPKQHFRLVFYACMFLLQYLDYTVTASPADQDAARRAVTTTHQVFKQFRRRRETLRAANTIEVLGRSIVPGQRRLKTLVKTRMGASLNFNTIALAAQLRGRDHDPEDRAPVSTHVATFYAQNASIAGGNTAVSAPAEVRPVEATVEMGGTTQELFPWGIWNDEVYDQLVFNFDEQFFPGFAGNMEIF